MTSTTIEQLSGALGIELQEYDPEWLHKRGNYTTLITPEVARALLELNTNNRKLKDLAIRDYARDMAAGRWDADASDLKVSSALELVDGQNRLHACLRAGVPFPTLLRTGVHPQAKNKVDQGVKRTVADSLVMLGYKQGPVTAAAIATRVRYERALAGDGRPSKSTVRMTRDEALEYAEKHPQLARMGELAGELARMGPAIPASVYLAWLSMVGETNEQQARLLARRMIDGNIGGPGDPGLSLIRYLAVQRANRQGSPGNRGAKQAQMHLSALIQVWNAFLQDEAIDYLVVRDTDRLVSPL